MPATKFEKGKVKEKIDPKVLSALSTAFGYKVDDVDDLDYEEYHNELREAIQIGKGSLSSAEMGLLVMERKRIRSEKSVYKEDFKEKKTIMTAADIKKGSSIQLAEKSALSLYKGGVGQSPEETDDNLGDIEDKLDDILESLKEEGELDEDKVKAAKKKAEQEKRAKKEKNLERWKALKTTASKIVKPFRSLWDKVWGFISKILIGSVLVKIIKWMGDKKNQSKIESIAKFFKDWWPTMLAAYLLFGNAFGRMAVKLTAMFVKFTIRFVSQIVPQLIAAIGKLKIGKVLNMIPGGGKFAPLIKNTALIGGGMLLEKGLSGDFSGDSEETQNFATGGFVSGPGGVDQVPAKLTAGEFVMSKGAVQKYGANTLAAMNAAGGGTNRPTIRGGYNEGGKAADRSHFGTMGYRFGQINPDMLVSSSEVYSSKTTDRTEKRGMLDKFFNRDFDSFKEKDLGRGLPGMSMQSIDKFRTTDEGGTLEGETILTEDIASVGLPDIMEHQEDLMRRINAVKGFEDKTIEDVINSTVGMDAQQYTRLLNRSDAARATEKKRELARKQDRESGLSDTNRWLEGFNGGGLVPQPQLVPQFNGGGLVPIPGFAGGGQVRLGGRSGAKMRLAPKTTKVKTVNPPVKKSPLVTTQKINKMRQNSQTTGKGGSEVPSFDAEKYISKLKIETLGITV